MRTRTALALLGFAAALSGDADAATPARIADDYPRALSEARRRDVPILVDVWAPW